MSLITQMKSTILLAVLLAAGRQGMAQEKYHAKDDLQIVVSGTSTLHDWDMKTLKGESNAMVTLNGSGQLAALTALQFSLPVQGLKSEHSGMDNNAYKALKTDKYSTISYTLTSAYVEPNGTIKCLGKLTIAGATVDAPLTATGQVNADKSITVKGSKKISMKDFNITPPTFMLGTVKTGNDATVAFTLTLKK